MSKLSLKHSLKALSEDNALFRTYLLMDRLR